MDDKKWTKALELLTRRATLLGEVQAWNQLAKWLTENDKSYYAQGSLINLIFSKTDELNVELDELAEGSQ